VIDDSAGGNSFAYEASEEYSPRTDADDASMDGHKRFLALACAVLLAEALSACAVYRKCGFAGCLGDAKITAAVQALFDQHPVLEPPNLLTVRTLDRVVYLSGVVDTDFERQMAESVALEAKGVARVVNSIGISGGR
jgi:hypothetical protein